MSVPLIIVLNSSLIVIRPEYAWPRYCGVIFTARRKFMTSPVRLRSFLTLLPLYISTFSDPLSVPPGTSTSSCILTAVEPGLGIICACLPTMPSIFNEATWSQISSLPVIRTVYAGSSERLKRLKSSKQSASSSQSRKANPKVNVLITSPAEAWKLRTMSAMQRAEDGSGEQKSMV